MDSARKPTERADTRGAPVSAVVFDLDGVLVDTEPLQQRAYIDTFARHGVMLGTHDLLPWLGHREAEILAGLVGARGLDTALSDLRTERRSRYIALLEENLQPMQGAVDIVRAIYDTGFRCALASSSGREEVNACLVRLGIQPIFEAVVTGDDVAYAKPHPEIYTSVLDKLALHSSQCIAVEDSAVGVVAAERAGLKTVAVPNQLTRSQDFSKAGWVVDNLSDVMNILKVVGQDRQRRS